MTEMMRIQGEVSEECIEWWIVGQICIVTQRRLALQYVKLSAGSTMEQILLSHKKFARFFRRTKSSGKPCSFQCRKAKALRACVLRECEN